MAKRIILIVFGVVLLLIGLAAALGGGAVMAITGSDDTVQSGSHRLSTATTALVTPVANIEHTGGATDTLGSPDLRLALTNTANPTFVGIGPADAVDRYLAGAPVEQVNDLKLDPFRLVTSTVPGAGRPQPPGAQTFWVTQAVGNDPSLNWKLTSGSYRMVIMNASGAPGVVTDGSVALRVPHLFAIGIGVLVGGLVVLLVGVLLLVLGLISGRKARPVATPAPVWQAGGPPPHGFGGPPQQGFGAPPQQPSAPLQESESPTPSLRKPPQ